MNINTLNDNNNNSNLSPKSFKSFIKEIGVGAYLFIMLTLLTIMSFFKNLFLFHPRKLFTLQFFSCVTNSIVFIGFLSFAFQIFLSISWSLSSEKTIGTVRWIYRIIFYSICLSLMHYVLYIIRFTFLGLSLFSIWPTYFSEISRNCFKDPEKPSGLCLLPIKIKNKFIPFAILLLSFVFNNGKLSWADLTPILFGFMLNKFETFFEIFQLSSQMISVFEFDCLKNFIIGTFYFSQTQTIKESSNFNKISFKSKFFAFFKQLKAKIFNRNKDKETIRNQWVGKYDPDYVDQNNNNDIENPKKQINQQQDELNKTQDSVEMNLIKNQDSDLSIISIESNEQQSKDIKQKQNQTQKEEEIFGI